MHLKQIMRWVFFLIISDTIINFMDTILEGGLGMTLGLGARLAAAADVALPLSLELEANRAAVSKSLTICSRCHILVFINE